MLTTASIRSRDSKNPWSLAGTPSSSQMTRDGTGRANDSTRSVGDPVSSTLSIAVSTIRWMRGRMAGTERRDQQPSVPTVLWWVHVDEEAVVGTIVVGSARPFGSSGVRADPRVAEDLPRLGVAGDRPDRRAVGQVGADERRAGAHPLILGRR